MTKSEIQAVLEGAYAQVPTFPGYWIKYEDFRNKATELLQSKSSTPIDVDQIVLELFPDAKFLDPFQVQGSEEVFRAFRITPQKLVHLKSLKAKLERAIGAIPIDGDGWANFANVGQNGLKDETIQMGFMGTRHAVTCLFHSRYEFKAGDPSLHQAPVSIRDKKKISTANVEIADETTSARIVSPTKVKQGSFIREMLDSYAYFPRPKDSMIYGWDYAINDLATNLALAEQWYYDDSEKQTKPILKNYICFTFERLMFEDSEEKKNAKKEGRAPKLKILENSRNSVFNTGLVNNLYEPIFAFFKKNDGSNPSVKQPWIFVAFGTANSWCQNIITDFPYAPHRAEYFTDPTDLYYDTTANDPTLNWDHFFKDNIERLPIGFIKKGATQGFQFMENVDALPKAQRDAYYSKLSDAIYADEDWLSFLTISFQNALAIALSRVAWNYKTAIPVYYEEKKKISLLLPLALAEKGKIDVALVCQHKLDKEKGVNNYVGRTIFTLPMAYNNARLITRPDSDWLMAAKVVEH